MPLDGHSYLVAQGWSGKGSGLRQGAISRPLAIPQKRTLAGLGKDRDEAFPFWDHVFSVAAKTIQVKIHKDDDENSDTDAESTPSLPVLTRSSTGLLSNKRPIVGTPASFVASSPGAGTSSLSNAPRMSLLAIAKREAARKGLYARFFRGPVLGPDADFEEKIASTSTAVAQAPALPAITTTDIQNSVDDLSRKRKEKSKDKDGKVAGKERKRKRDKEEKGKEREKEKIDAYDDDEETSKQERKHTSTVKDRQDNDKKREKKRRRKAEHDNEDGGEDVLPERQMEEPKLKKKRRKEERIKDDGADSKEQILKRTLNINPYPKVKSS